MAAKDVILVFVARAEYNCALEVGEEAKYTVIGAAVLVVLALQVHREVTSISKANTEYSVQSVQVGATARTITKYFFPIPEELTIYAVAGYRYKLHAGRAV
jgi:hypothetical protein